MNLRPSHEPVLGAPASLPACIPFDLLAGKDAGAPRFIASEHVHKEQGSFLARAAVTLLIMLATYSASACAVCYGRSDSAMARGFNWGIISLLLVVGFVLASIAAFFIFIIRRSASLAARPAAPAPETIAPAGSEKL